MNKQKSDKTAAIIVAAGRGNRAGGGKNSSPKQFQKVGGTSILARTLMYLRT